HAVASTLGLREQPGLTAQQRLVETLQPHAALLVLDNCEHLLPACAALADALLRLCPSLRVMATSREPLGVSGEVLWRVPSLALPRLQGRVQLASLAEAESVRLFVDRAQAAAPNFVLSDVNAAAVAEVCRRLDGIPLALELAAARARTLSPEQIADRLEN